MDNVAWFSPRSGFKTFLMKLKELLLFSMFSVLKSKELFIRFTACAFRKLLSIYVFSYCFLLLFLFVCCFFFFFFFFFVLLLLFSFFLSFFFFFFFFEGRI